jgi:cell wall-associated NlpC family hydrolase
MKAGALALIVACLFCASIAHAVVPQSVAVPAETFWDRVKLTIEGYLGRPYVWGSAGLRSFDCSGFVWRIMYENGILFKRTTARKLYMSLPKPAAGENWSFGNVIFFDNLKHCGIINNREFFYHAQSSIGTNLTKLTPFWRDKIVGFRCLTPK